MGSGEGRPDPRELLPWLLNGTLRPEERVRVEEWLGASGANRRELEQVRQALEIFAQVLPAEVLVAYAAGEVPAGRSRELIERHLDLFPEAREELEMVRESLRALEDDPGVDLPTPPRVRSAASSWARVALAASLIAAVALGGWIWSWQRVGESENRLAEVRVRLEEVRGEAAAPAPEAGEPRSENEGLAIERAGLLEELARQGERVESLTRQLARHRRPLANLPLIEAFPGELVLRGGEAAGEVTEIPPEVGEAALILNSRVGAADGPLGLELADPTGRVIWSFEGPLERDPASLATSPAFVVLLPTTGLDRGDYELRLLRRGEAEPELLETYRLRVG